MSERYQSSTTLPIPFFMVLSSDHVTPATGKTPAVQIRKPGGGFGAALGAVTEIGNGWYELAANATDRNTLGTNALRATAAGCDETPWTVDIIPNVVTVEPIGNVGDVFQGLIANVKFRTLLNGQPATLAGATVVAYSGSSTFNSSAGITLTPNHNGVVGTNHLSLDTTFIATVAGDYQLVLAAGTVGGIAVSSTVLGLVSVWNRTYPEYTSSVSYFSTILSWLGSWTGGGNNNILGAFKAVANKGAPLPSDLSISGGFAPAQHSLQAIRERGDVAWITGSGGGGGTGAYAVTITITDSAAAPLQNVTLRINSGAEAYTLLTDVTGQATFSLNAATWTVVAVRSGYQLAPQSLVVAAATAQTYSMTAVTVTPSAPGRVTGYLYTYSELGVIEPGVSCTLQLKHGPDPGVAYDSSARTVVSDGTGKVEFPNLFRGATYSLYRGTARPVEITISPIATDPVAIGPVVGT